MTHNAIVIPVVVRARVAGSVDSALDHLGGVGGKHGSGGAPGATGSVSNVSDVVGVNAPGEEGSCGDGANRQEGDGE
jgi:hypothetical protein